jgi:hypothetical protein
MTRALLLVLFGCQARLPSGETATPARVETGQCDIDLGAAPLGGYSLLYAGPHVWWGARELNFTEVLSDAEEWAAFTSDLRLTLPSPDFPSQVGVAVWEPRERCELEFHSVEVYDLEESLHIQADFHDYEGGCQDICADPGGVLVVVALSQRVVEPTACRVTWDRCAVP